MTVEEFRRFGWRAGMKVTYRQHDQFWTDEILEVDFDQGRVTLDDHGEFLTLEHDEIRGVLNPDGTVAYHP